MIEVVKIKFINLHDIFRAFVLYDFIITYNDVSRLGLLMRILNVCTRESYYDDVVYKLTQILNFNWHPTTPLDYVTEDTDEKLLLILYIDNPVNYSLIINKSRLPHKMILKDLSDELRELYYWIRN